MVLLSTLAMTIGMAVCVWRDADGRDFSQSRFARSRGWWTFAVFALGLIAFVMYMIKRNSYPRAGTSGGIGPGGAWAPPVAGAPGAAAPLAPMTAAPVGIGTSVPPPPRRFPAPPS